MKKISILILFLISFTVTKAQTTVSLRDLMEHFIQKDDSLQIIKARELEKDSVILAQDNLLKADNVIISLHSSDSLKFRQIIARKDTIILNNEEEAKIAKKEHKRQKRKLVTSIVGLSLLEIGTLTLLILSL